MEATGHVSCLFCMFVYRKSIIKEYCDNGNTGTNPQGECVNGSEIRYEMYSVLFKWHLARVCLLCTSLSLSPLRNFSRLCAHSRLTLAIHNHNSFKNIISDSMGSFCDILHAPPPLPLFSITVVYLYLIIKSYNVDIVVVCLVGVIGWFSKPTLPHTADDHVSSKYLREFLDEMQPDQIREHLR